MKQSSVLCGSRYDSKVLDASLTACAAIPFARRRPAVACVGPGSGVADELGTPVGCAWSMEMGHLSCTLAPRSDDVDESFRSGLDATMQITARPGRRRVRYKEDALLLDFRFRRQMVWRGVGITEVVTLQRCVLAALGLASIDDLGPFLVGTTLIFVVLV